MISTIKKFDDDLESSNQPSSRPSYIPSYMPPFPSKHTYKKTPAFPKRLDYNPTRIRKMRLEQSRLIENSLQKLSKHHSSNHHIDNASSNNLYTEEDSPSSSLTTYDTKLIRCLTDELILNQYSKVKSERIKSSCEDILEKQKNL
nr:10763_t:CDS:2 [Entrophospora candida]